MANRPRVDSARGRQTPQLNGLRSPSLSSSGRASPFPAIKVKAIQPASRPASPGIQRAPLFKRPASSARNHETGIRAPSPLVDSRRYTPANSNDFRSSSAMSNRSTGTSAGLPSKGAANTTVSIRIRPSLSESMHRYWTYEDYDNRIRSIPRDSEPELDFSYDHVFKEASTNQLVYQESVKHLISGVMEGYHATVFAYGMTGTGKTYSMQGTQTDPGIIPLAIEDLFDLIAEDTENAYLLKVSYLEIYNEKIRDLLNETSGDAEEIKIRDDPRRGLHAYPLIEVGIESKDAFLAVMAKGDILRHNAATDFNAHSSRSHAVIQVVVETKPRSIARLGAPSRISTLNLIDLAGSEKAASDADRRKEGSYINKSLLTLGTVIAKLTSTNNSGSVAHIPFRDSKLTRLLQNALSGLSLVSILATINTGQAYVSETKNTLIFASRAKFIPGKAQKAELSGGSSAALIESLRAEVQSLRAQLAASEALVAKLQKSSGQSSIDNKVNGSRDDAIPSRLSEINENVASLPYTPVSAKLGAQIHEDEEPWEHKETHNRLRSTSVTSPSGTGNFSLPSHLSREGQEATTPSRYDEAKHEDRADRMKTLADQELASKFLTKSQRSREEGRHLRIQLAQLKSREDRRTMAGNPFSGLGKMSTMYNNENDDALDGTTTTSARNKQMTLISPSIRPPPREGFI